MAMDIFTGTYLKVEVGSAGSTVATDFIVVDNVATFTTSGYESTVVTVKTFNSKFDRKLIGTANVPDISLEVNYVPDSVAHMKLEDLADAGTRCQIKISYFEDSSMTTGFYNVYQCFVSSTSVAGDKDQAIVKTYTLAVDGGAVAGGLLPIVP
ncbi:hypothetical protein R0H17_25150 [Phytobacter diazotrophicus]|uniref:hypothetical protein n=1 Tax=Phytobacter diazotrophicus TaxID=395631 RepID=UPI00293543EC|nr:hypothetical protein [Phytobacter diazotrophicus]MDV2904912.1 hypothetical protein [Phytobacter diazotrophicus]